MAKVFLSLGSNIGDRVGFLQQATGMLGANENIKIISTSSFYESEPWQMVSENWFVNAIVYISTTLTPDALLAECQRIESLLGRNVSTDKKIYSDRTIDIDILFYDNIVINSKELTIPHTLLHKRGFTLVPLLEIAPDFVHPVFGKSIETLFDELENPEMVCLYGTRI